MRSFCVIFLIMGFTSSVCMETCPAKEDIYPCVCDEAHIQESGDILVTCSDVSLNLETLKQALSGLSGKNQVDLSLQNLQLGKLPSNYFSGIGIKKLDIKFCFLDSLTNDDQPGLLGLENHLQELTIVRSFTEKNEPAKINLGHLKKLKKIALLYNTISILEDDWFSNGPASLEIIELFNNNIVKIGSSAFAMLNNLRSLYVIGNDLGSVTRNMFPATAEKLEVLELDKNILADIPEDIFSRMPSIHSVSLMNNQIMTIEERTWSSIWQQLGTVSLEGNGMYCDEKLDWILSYKESPRIYGRCRYPEEFESIEIEEFLKSRNQ